MYGSSEKYEAVKKMETTGPKTYCDKNLNLFFSFHPQLLR